MPIITIVVYYAVSCKCFRCLFYKSVDPDQAGMSLTLKALPHLQQTLFSNLVLVSRKQISLLANVSHEMSSLIFLKSSKNGIAQNSPSVAAVIGDKCVNIISLVFLAQCLIQ